MLRKEWQILLEYHGDSQEIAGGFTDLISGAMREIKGMPILFVGNWVCWLYFPARAGLSRDTLWRQIFYYPYKDIKK